mmetsp:Transcript_38000/g.52758  ORF Transcript_38000/g.52758 Transcript_38000/m.52758 type:complete len:95 (+) Transcript_38000:137-421(+)
MFVSDYYQSHQTHIIQFTDPCVDELNFLSFVGREPFRSLPETLWDPLEADPPRDRLPDLVPSRFFIMFKPTFSDNTVRTSTPRKLAPDLSKRGE